MLLAGAWRTTESTPRSSLLLVRGGLVDVRAHIRADPYVRGGLVKEVVARYYLSLINCSPWPLGA